MRIAFTDPGAVIGDRCFAIAQQGQNIGPHRAAVATARDENDRLSVAGGHICGKKIATDVNPDGHVSASHGSGQSGRSLLYPGVRPAQLGS